jgi:hypothetical protein
MFLKYFKTNYNLFKEKKKNQFHGQQEAPVAHVGSRKLEKSQLLK